MSRHPFFETFEIFLKFLYQMTVSNSIQHLSIEEHVSRFMNLPFPSRVLKVSLDVILFLKSMSETVGSDIKRLWNWISRSTQNGFKKNPFKFKVVLCRIRLFPTSISKFKWPGSGPPLKFPGHISGHFQNPNKDPTMSSCQGIPIATSSYSLVATAISSAAT